MPSYSICSQHRNQFWFNFKQCLYLSVFTCILRICIKKLLLALSSLKIISLPSWMVDFIFTRKWGSVKHQISKLMLLCLYSSCTCCLCNSRLLRPKQLYLAEFILAQLLKLQYAKCQSRKCICFQLCFDTSE